MSFAKDLVMSINAVTKKSIWARIFGKVKQRIARLPLVASVRSRWQESKQISEWIAAGKPVPPPHHIKQRIVRKYARRYETRVMVETGTFMGDMVQAMRRHFDKVFSIELSSDLFRRACDRFLNSKNVKIMQGDSAIILPRILESINQPTLFWLDGHYSEGITALGDKETPILAELDHILRHSIQGHVILIDDARCFNGTHDYPTLSELRQYIEQRRPNMTFEVETDIVRIV